MIRRRLVFFLAVIVVLFSQSLFSRPVSASPVVIRSIRVSLTCSSITIVGDLFGQIVTKRVLLSLGDVTTDSLLFDGSVQAIDGNINATITFPPVPGHLVVVGGGLSGTSSFMVPACPPVTWFAPGDGRVDPLPGDRIAVWCNTTATPPTVVVYGVGDASNGSNGFWLATFNNADLLKAGAAGIVKDAGAGNGTVSLANDGDGNFYAAWTGGIFNATGQGIFAKSFSCTF